jgi:hypothetical protein
MPIDEVNHATIRTRLVFGQGPAGSRGPIGEQGPSGVEGATGPMGATGPVGPSGSQGPTGSIGPTGPTGPTGNTGPQGSIGLQGLPGPSDWNAIPNKPVTFPPANHSHTFAELNAKPTTLSGYGITDGLTNINSDGTLNVTPSGSTRSVSLNLASINTWTGLQTFNEAVVQSIRLTTSTVFLGRALMADESIVLFDPPLLEYFDCSPFSDQSSCEAKSFCSWSSWDCTGYTTQEDCNGNSHCGWSMSSCPEFTDQTSCENYSECSWNSGDEVCEGGSIASTAMCNGGMGEQCSGDGYDESPATLTLPSSAAAGKNYWLKNSGNSSQTAYVKLDDTTLFTINPFEGIHIVHTNGTWHGLTRGSFA